MLKINMSEDFQSFVSRLRSLPNIWTRIGSGKMSNLESDHGLLYDFDLKSMVNIQ